MVNDSLGCHTLIAFTGSMAKAFQDGPKIPGSLAQAQSKHKFEINGSKFQFCTICIKTTYILSFSCLIHPKHLVFKSPDSHNLSFPPTRLSAPCSQEIAWIIWQPQTRNKPIRPLRSQIRRPSNLDATTKAAQHHRIIIDTTMISI